MDPAGQADLDAIRRLIRDNELAFNRRMDRAEKREERRYARTEARLDRAEARLDRAEARADRFDQKWENTRQLVRAGIRMMVKMHQNIEQMAKEQRTFIRSLHNGHNGKGNGSRRNGS